MQVRALQAGFFGGRRRPGDVFEVPEGAKATWFAPVGDVKAPAAGKAKAKEEPQALSQVGKQQPQSMTQVLAGDKKDGADLV